jgi:transcriptional regulator with XRE-family HTH domain
MNEGYGIPAEEIARRCGVSLKTAQRWKRGATRMPKTSAMILAGDLGCFDPAWKGWILRKGQIISPEGWAVTPGDLLALPLMRSQITAYQAEQRRVQAMEAQPEPEAAPRLFSARALRG